jgi:hypothetical protein
MKIRILKVIWVISIIWLLLIIYGGTLGTANGQLIINLITFGWISLIGLLSCYFVTGSFLYPQKKEPIQKIYKPLDEFIYQITRKIDSYSSRDDILYGYALLFEKISEIERLFGVYSTQLSFSEDDLRNAFHFCSNLKVIEESALMVLDNKDADYLEDVFDSGEYRALPEHLRLRFAKCFIISKLDDLEVHPTELTLSNQEAFYELEKYGEVTAELLEQKYGIIGWVSQEELNNLFVTPDFSKFKK